MEAPFDFTTDALIVLAQCHERSERETFRRALQVAEKHGLQGEVMNTARSIIERDDDVGPFRALRWALNEWDL